jgi:hypothetical protein
MKTRMLICGLALAAVLAAAVPLHHSSWAGQFQPDTDVHIEV